MPRTSSRPVAGLWRSPRLDASAATRARRAAAATPPCARRAGRRRSRAAAAERGDGPGRPGSRLDRAARPTPRLASAQGGHRAHETEEQGSPVPRGSGDAQAHAPAAPRGATSARARRRWGRKAMDAMEPMASPSRRLPRHVARRGRSPPRARRLLLRALGVARVASSSSSFSEHLALADPRTRRRPSIRRWPSLTATWECRLRGGRRSGATADVTAHRGGARLAAGGPGAGGVVRRLSGASGSPARARTAMADEMRRSDPRATRPAARPAARAGRGRGARATPRAGRADDLDPATVRRRRSSEPSPRAAGGPLRACGTFPRRHARPPTPNSAVCASGRAPEDRRGAGRVVGRMGRGVGGPRPEAEGWAASRATRGCFLHDASGVLP